MGTINDPIAHDKYIKVRRIRLFWEKTKKNELNDCIEWTGRMMSSGYGQVTFLEETWSAHRLIWTLINGSIPEGLQINHTCDNRKCVNLVHLNLGTQSDNMQDMINKGRANKASGDRHRTKTHPESYRRSI